MGGTRGGRPPFAFRSAAFPGQLGAAHQITREMVDVELDERTAHQRGLRFRLGPSHAALFAAQRGYRLPA